MESNDEKCSNLSITESGLDDHIFRLVTDILESILKDFRSELIQMEEEALKRSTNLLVEYILIESCMEEYEKSLSKANMNLIEARSIQNDSYNDPVASNLDQAEINKISNSPFQPSSIQNEDEELESIHSNEKKEVIVEQNETDSDDSEFDGKELKNLQQEQLSRKVIERASNMLNVELKAKQAGLNKRRSIYGSWTAGLNLSNNESEVRIKESF